MNGFLLLLAAGLYLCSQCQVNAGECDLHHLQIARDAFIIPSMKLLAFFFFFLSGYFGRMDETQNKKKYHVRSAPSLLRVHWRVKS